MARVVNPGQNKVAKFVVFTIRVVNLVKKWGKRNGVVYDQGWQPRSIIEVGKLHFMIRVANPGH